ncbi:MAG TPA: MBL fold metallo-hydrolase [Bryobacteraceae bacterium]|nr:MBL fold metallo-hydrolase [Bryobacteraceae bacterium]
MKALAAALLLLACLLPAGRAQDAGEVLTLKVQGNVYLITGAGGNIAVQTGDQGVLVVDTGLTAMSGKVLAAIRKLSDKPIQYVINTHVHPDHTGGNDAIRMAGLTYVGANVTGNLTDAGVGAQIWAQDNVLKRMSAPTGVQPAAPFGAWPTETYVSGRKQLFFNGEPIEIIYQPAAHTDGDSLVLFRRSDVVVTGDIFVTTSYPFIDLERGGSIQGEVDALNNLMEIAIPGLQDEGGTYIIPGHGRICDQPDLLEYRDMVTIIRDRVQSAIKKGMSLDQVKAARLTRDYDGRYGAKSGFGTRDQFVEAIYRSLARTGGR